MERTISVWSDRNIRGQIWGGRLWSVISVNSTEISLSICHMIAVLSTSRLYPAYKNNYRTRGGLVQVCATECTVPLGTWNFRNFKREFLLNGECPVYFQLVVLFTAPPPPPRPTPRKKKKKRKHTLALYNRSYWHFRYALGSEVFFNYMTLSAVRTQNGNLIFCHHIFSTSQ